MPDTNEIHLPCYMTVDVYRMFLKDAQHLENSLPSRRVSQQYFYFLWKEGAPEMKRSCTGLSIAHIVNSAALSLLVLRVIQHEQNMGAALLAEEELAAAKFICDKRTRDNVDQVISGALLHLRFQNAITITDPAGELFASCSPRRTVSRI